MIRLCVWVKFVDILTNKTMFDVKLQRRNFDPLLYTREKGRLNARTVLLGFQADNNTLMVYQEAIIEKYFANLLSQLDREIQKKP